MWKTRLSALTRTLLQKPIVKLHRPLHGAAKGLRDVMVVVGVGEILHLFAGIDHCLVQALGKFQRNIPIGGSVMQLQRPADVGYIVNRRNRRPKLGILVPRAVRIRQFLAHP